MGKTSTRIGRFLGYLVGLAGLAAIASAYIPDVFGAALSSPTAAPLVVCNTTCSGAGIQPRQTYTVVKPSQTSRTSTTTVTDDPHLSITSLPAGVYAIEATIKTSNYTASGAGFRMLLAGGADPSCTASNTQSASYTPLGLSAGGVEGTIAAGTEVEVYQIDGAVAVVYPRNLALP